MKKILFFFFFFSYLIGSTPDSFLEDEDPTVFHNVNVITGQLNLSFQDTVIKGPSPFPIYRTYTSGNAIEPKPDLKIQGYRGGWVFGGGWNLLPHIYILHRYDPNTAGFIPSKLYISEKSGNLVQYGIKKCQKSKRLYLPMNSFRTSGDLSPRNDTSKNRLEIDEKKYKAILYRPDGSISYFSLKDRKKHTYFYFWLLDEEILPNKHRVKYTYTDDDLHHLKSIELKNPAGNITFGSITFDPEKYWNEQIISASTSDGKKLHFEMMVHKHQKYLEKTDHSCLPKEFFHYRDGRKSTGA
nr:hypothetical protein [Chlamydiota bacterium]